MRSAYAYPQSPAIPLFNTALRGVGPGGIPVASPSPFPASVTGVTQYQILIRQFQDQIVPGVSGLGPTTLWGYDPLLPLGGGRQPQKHLGGIIVGQRGNPIQVTFHNLLWVNRHIIPVDTTIPGANQDVNRVSVHMHGALVPWISDGGPFDWFLPDGRHGLSFLNNQVLNPIHLPGAGEYYYPLNQSARFMWYHDHAVGTTRLNAYAGLATALFIRDNFEAGLINAGLPNYVEAGGKEIPLIFQDKIFVGPHTLEADPGWGQINLQSVTQNPGSLYYAHTYEPNQTDGTGRWDLAEGGLPLPDPSNIPEFFGDTMLVNGTAFPEATVEARRYRLRMLNACNARFLNLQLYIDDGSPDGITLDADGAPTNLPFINAATGNPSWLQIGTEGGFLPHPVEIPSNAPFLIADRDFQDGGPSLNPSLVEKSLVVAPAERTDLIVDFRGYAGSKVVLYNDGPSPFPSGDDRNDYFPGWNVGDGLFGGGNPTNGVTLPGNGPNTRVLMRFKVVPASGASDVALAIDTGTNLRAGNDPLVVPEGVLDPPPVDNTRFLSLNEYADEYGRLVQILGNAEEPYGSPYFGSASYLDKPNGLPSVGSTEERVKAGDTEVWEIYNTTGDVHPMHFHLVNVQVINRQVFDPSSGFPYALGGDPIPPAPNEIGWKETVPMYPGTVTRVYMKWDLATIVDKRGRPVNSRRIGNIRLPIVNGQPPVSPRTGGHEFVWHCHILEHEEHDMMHALVVEP